MRVNVYRLRVFKAGEKEFFRDFDFEFKDEKYQKAKRRLRKIGYVRELFAWN